MGDLRSEYETELADFRLAYSKGGCIAGCVLVAAGVGLDLSFYPNQVVMLGIARGITTALMAIILAVLYSDLGRRHVQGLTLTWLALPQLMIAWMIAVTHGAGGPYVFGLTLALYAGGLLLAVGGAQSFALGAGTTLAYYFAAILDADASVPHSTIVGNSIFIAFSATAATVGTWFNERGRMKIFNLQRQVKAKNKVLEEHVHKLAEMKGMMIQQEKMASLGTLSAGLMHEVNNPVNYSLMALNAALRDPAVVGNPGLTEMISDARGGMLRTQGIVTDLKAFAYQKPNGDVGRVFVFEKALHSALRLTSFELKAADVEVKLPLNTHVHGEEPAVISVLVNLLGNAALALAGAARARPDFKPRVDVAVERHGDRMVVRVRDNGVGISPEDLPRVFDPFFTTRDVGEGLGLGLAVSYSIIQRHGGRLSVQSELGAWSEFQFDLAVAMGAHASEFGKASARAEADAAGVVALTPQPG